MGPKYFCIYFIKKLKITFCQKALVVNHIYIVQWRILILNNDYTIETYQTEQLNKWDFSNCTIKFSHTEHGFTSENYQTTIKSSHTEHGFTSENSHTVQLLFNQDNQNCSYWTLLFNQDFSYCAKIVLLRLFILYKDCTIKSSRHLNCTIIV